MKENMNTKDVNETIAWHFTGSTLRDGSPIPAVGQTLIFQSKIKICEAGYHWSRRPSHALRYAPGPMLHKVSFGGNVQEQSDKGVSSERTILASIDSTQLLRRFADDNFWVMPEILRKYLTTQPVEPKLLRMTFFASRAAQASAASAAADAAAAQGAVRGDVAWWTAWWTALNAAETAAWDEFDRRVYDAFQKEA